MLCCKAPLKTAYGYGLEYFKLFPETVSNLIINFFYRKPDKVNNTNTTNSSRRRQVTKETEDKELRTNFINSESFEKDPLKQEKRKLFWSLSGSVVKKTNDESKTFAPTDRYGFTKRNQTTCTENRHLSNQGEFSGMKLNMNQTEDNQNGEKSVGFDGIWYSN